MKVLIPLFSKIYSMMISFSCVLCTHKEDQRDSLKSFLDILKKLYADAVAFSL